MDNTAQQYAEELFESINLIYQNKSNQVSFDRTIVCEVIGTYEDTPNKYLVSTGALKFDAYTQSELEYSKGTQVYVLIPGGDYSKTKLIIGSYNIDKELSKQLYTNPFDYLIYKQKYSFENIQLGESKSHDDIEFYTKGISNYNCIGIDFSLTTSGIEDTRGEYHIVLQLLDEEGKKLGLFPFSSKQLYGNPYNLNSMLRFEHLFELTMNSTTLSKVKKLMIHLVSENDYVGEAVVLNDINIYFGFNTDNENSNIKNNQVKLYLDNNTDLNYAGQEAVPDNLTLYIDWRKNDTNVVYSGLEGSVQYPIPTEDKQEKNWYVYWLQYRPNNEGETSENDIDEAGIYWTTIKKVGAWEKGAYTLFSIEDDIKVKKSISFDKYKQEQFKVIIKNTETGEYIESNGLTFNNTAWSPVTATNVGQPLLLTLSDDGIYNNYGIDNKRLDTNKETQITADFADNREWKDSDIKSIVWKVPAAASMFEKPYILKDNSELQDDPAWDDYEDFYIRQLKETDTEVPKTITVFRDDQFDYNKTNNTIYCTVETMDETIYSGSITLQFGTQGTSGSGYSFNIRPDRYGPLAMPYINEKDEEVNPYIKFTAYLENNNGEAVEFDGKNVTWNVIQGSTNRPVKSTKNVSYTEKGDEIHSDWASTGDSVILRVNKDEEIEQVTIVNDLEGKEIFNQEDILYETLPYYNILMATLNEWTDTNGNEIKLTAYYPIPYTESSECINYYISGATRVVYNAQGTSRNYDESPYVLYGSDSQPIENVEWSVLTIENDISSEDYGKPKVAENGDNCPGLELLDDVSGLKKLSPINLPTDVRPCSIIAYNNDTVLWAQPLLMIRNNYAYPMVNSWDGGLTIDNKGNYILTELIGAGTKDKDNKYTGVLMGAIGKTGAAATTGLYGFNTGELRYKLDEKGNFYVGTDDYNKIDFNEGKLGINVKTFTLKTEGETDEDRDLIIDSEAIGDNYAIKFKDKFYVTANGNKALVGGWSIESDRIVQDSKKLLPPGYTQIEYIETDGNCYIDTGIEPDQNTGFEIQFATKNEFSTNEPSESTPGYGCIFGSRKYSGTDEFQLTTYTDTGFTGGILRFGSNKDNKAYQCSAFLNENKKPMCKLQNLQYVDPKGSKTMLDETIAFKSPYTILIGALHQENGTSHVKEIVQFGKVAIYSFKLYDRDICVRNFVPVLNKSNVPGLYDLISGDFYTKQGEGQLKAGSVAAWNTLLDASSGTIISKNLIAKGGNIGGWTIEDSRLEADRTVIDNKNKWQSGYRTGMQCISGDSSAAFYAGCTTAAGGSIASEAASNFYVRNDGYMYCKNAKIAGEITATNLTLSGSATLPAAKVTGTLSAAELSFSKLIGGTSSASLNASNIHITGQSTIAGWAMDSNSIYKGDWKNYSDNGLVFMCTRSTGSLTLGGHSGTNWIFGCYPNFGVNWNGELYASGGKIGLWEINQTALTVELYENNITTRTYVQTIPKGTLMYYNVMYNNSWTRVLITPTGIIKMTYDALSGSSKKYTYMSADWGKTSSVAGYYLIKIS